MISSVGRISKRRAIPLLFSDGIRLARAGVGDFGGGGDGTDLGGYDDNEDGWDGAWVVAPFYLPGFLGVESFDSDLLGVAIPDGTSLNSLAYGSWWSAPWVSAVWYVPQLMGYDGFGELPVATDIDGASTGTDWSATFVARA